MESVLQLALNGFWDGLCNCNYFSDLDPDRNYIVAPQAPSKYYLGDTYKHVGASWLTREDTLAETANVLAYVDAVWEIESKQPHKNLIVMGYSQGVSIATRWLASRKIVCDQLVLHSGGIPVELEAGQFDYLPQNTPVTYIFGDKDQYITESRIAQEEQKASKLFGNRMDYKVFDGIHEVNKNSLKEISESL